MTGPEITEELQRIGRADLAEAVRTLWLEAIDALRQSEAKARVAEDRLLRTCLNPSRRVNA